MFWSIFEHFIISSLTFEISISENHPENTYVAVILSVLYHSFIWRQHKMSWKTFLSHRCNLLKMVYIITWSSVTGQEVTVWQCPFFFSSTIRYSLDKFGATFFRVRNGNFFLLPFYLLPFSGEVILVTPTNYISLLNDLITWSKLGEHKY